MQVGWPHLSSPPIFERTCASSRRWFVAGSVPAPVALPRKTAVGVRLAHGCACVLEGEGRGRRTEVRGEVRSGASLPCPNEPAVRR